MSSVSLSPTRVALLQTTTSVDLFQTIRDAEVEQIFDAAVKHFAVPFIAGLSLDAVSQEEFEARGGVGKKPAPLSDAEKLTLYKSIEQYFRPILIEKIQDLVALHLNLSLLLVSDEELRNKVSMLKERIKKEIDISQCKLPIEDLSKIHLAPFKELQSKSNLKVDLMIFHTLLCPIIEKHRSTGDFVFKIKLHEFLGLKKDIDFKKTERKEKKIK